MPLLPGKLPPRLLERLLRYRGAPDPRVTLGPAVGQDAAAIDLGRHYLNRCREQVRRPLAG